jgi:Ca2+-binding EF-hand superfamily protein
MYSGYPGQPQGYPPQPGYPPPQLGYPPPQQPAYGAPPPQGFGGNPYQQGPPAAYGAPQQFGAGYGVYAQPQQQFYAAPAPMGYQQPSPLREWFNAVDQDRSGRISVKELQSALSASGNKFSFATTEKLLNMYDRDKSGQISFDEFAQLHQFITVMATAFRQRDRSGDGSLEGSEVRAALNDSGYQLSEGTFQVMMRKFDRQRKGSLALDDYIELSIFISSVRNTFGFYDKTKTGQVTFSFDMFLAASIMTH